MATKFDPTRCGLPDKATHVACDEDGRWFSYLGQPTPVTRAWISDRDILSHLYSEGLPAPDWRDTLTEVRDGKVVEPEPDIQPDTSLYERNSPEFFRACALIAEGITRGEGVEVYCEDGFRQWQPVKEPGFHEFAHYRLRKPPTAPDVVWFCPVSGDENLALANWSLREIPGSIKYVRADK